MNEAAYVLGYVGGAVFGAAAVVGTGALLIWLVIRTLDVVSND